MGLFTDLPDTCQAACSASAGSVEITVGDLPPIPAPFMGPEMCPPDCGDGPAYQEVRKCSDDPEDGQSDVLVGSYVDGVWTPGASVPAGYVPCSKCPDQVEVTTKAPTWEPICVPPCSAGLVCVTQSNGVVSLGPWLVGDVEFAEAPEGWSFGACQVSDVCVKLWLPDDAGEFFTCGGAPYTVQMTAKGEIVAWKFGLWATNDPTVDLIEGTDYVLLPCDMTPVGELATTQTVVVPYDLGPVDGIDGNVLDGTATLTKPCTVSVEAYPNLDCKEPIGGVEITYTTCAGGEITETVPAGSTRCFRCLDGDVTLTGNGAVHATTTTEIPIETKEC